MACGPPCGVAVDRMESSGKTITFPGRFLISVGVIAWKSNPWRPLRHGVDNSCLKGRKPVRGVKESFPGAKDGLRVEWNQRRAEADQSHRRAIPTKIGQNPYAAVCTFDFDGQEVPQCLRAVGLRPNSDDFRMRFYAPYAVPLKGKRPKRLQLPKEVHKVHTASLMFAQPYSSWAFRFRRKSAYGVHTAAYEVHTDRIMRRKCEDVSWSRRGGIFSLPFFCPYPCPSGPFRPEIDCKLFFGAFGIVFGEKGRPSGAVQPSPRRNGHALRKAGRRAGRPPWLWTMRPVRGRRWHRRRCRAGCPNPPV